MGILITLLCFLIIYAILVTYVAAVQIKKNEKVERALEEIYGHVSTVLFFMRELDNKQMFEKDDEVGGVFTQLSDLVNTLGVIIGEKENDPSEED